MYRTSSPWWTFQMKLEIYKTKTLSNIKIWSLKEFGAFSVRFILPIVNTSWNPLINVFRYKRVTKPAIPDRMTFLHAIEACNNRLKQYFNQLFFWKIWKRFYNFLFFALRVKTQPCFSKYTVKLKHLQNLTFQL